MLKLRNVLSINILKKLKIKKISANPWFISIISGLIAGSIVAFSFNWRENIKHNKKVKNSKSMAYTFLKREMFKDALLLYDDISKIVYEKDEPRSYGIIQLNKGACYLGLAIKGEDKVVPLGAPMELVFRNEMA